MLFVRNSKHGCRDRVTGRDQVFIFQPECGVPTRKKNKQLLAFLDILKFTSQQVQLFIHSQANALNVR